MFNKREAEPVPKPKDCHFDDNGIEQCCIQDSADVESWKIVYL